MVQEFLALLFPNYCFTCKESLVKGETYICTSCRHMLPKTNMHELPDNFLKERFGGFLPFVHCLAFLKFTKGGKVQRIMEKLKYENCPEIGTLLGQWFGADLRETGFFEEFDLILPVPLHKSKLRKRGYNQSDYFAKGLANALEVPWLPDVLVRKVKSQSQTKKGRLERFENVSGIFELHAPQMIKDKNVLLVDDVITTGATLFASAQPIVQAGCKSISIATLAVAW